MIVWTRLPSNGWAAVFWWVFEGKRKQAGLPLGRIRMREKLGEAWKTNSKESEGLKTYSLRPLLKMEINKKKPVMAAKMKSPALTWGMVPSSR